MSKWFDQKTLAWQKGDTLKFVRTFFSHPQIVEPFDDLNLEMFGHPSDAHEGFYSV